MVEITWNPVKVKPRNGGAQVITGPNEALKFLDHDWDGAEGEFYYEAKRNCRRALQRSIDPERARQAFVGAFLDASLPIA
jgi:hypothetical protein